MIQPGQKLKEGDWCKVNSDQADELWIIGNGYKLGVANVQVVYIESGLMFYSTDSEYSQQKEYTFTDFKQLCENTFNK